MPPEKDENIDVATGTETEKTKEPKEKQRNDAEYVAMLRAGKKAASDYRIRQEVLWYEIQLLVDGDHYHFVNKRGSSTSGIIKVTPIKRRKGELLRTVNKFRALMRSIKAFTTSTQLRWEVIGTDDQTKIASNYLNWYSEFFVSLQGVIRNVLQYGLTRSVGYFDVYWDNDKKMPVVAARDPFDLVCDRNGRMYVRTFRKSIKDIKEEKDEDGNYLYFPELGEDERDQVKQYVSATSKQSGSDIYENYKSSKYNSKSDTHPDLEETMLEEYSILERGDDGKQRVRIVTLAESGDKIVREEETDDDEFRFVPYWPEERPNDVYNEPWMKDAMDPQRSLDNSFTHMEEFLRTMAKGRVLKHKDTKVDRISDRDGQVVEWEGSRAPEYWKSDGLDGGKFNFHSLAERMMEDLIGIHPSEIRKTDTARGIGYLMAQDETNISEPFENLKNALVEVARRVLKLSQKHMMSTQDIFWFDDNEDIQSGQVISEDADNKPEKAGVLKQYDNVRVELVPTGPFAAITREAKLFKLIELGIIRDPQNVMEGMNLGNVRQFIEREIEHRKQFPNDVPGGQGGGQPGAAPVDEANVPSAVPDDVTPRNSLSQVVEDINATIGDQ